MFQICMHSSWLTAQHFCLNESVYVCAGQTGAACFCLCVGLTLRVPHTAYAFYLSTNCTFLDTFHVPHRQVNNLFWPTTPITGFKTFLWPRKLTRCQIFMLPFPIFKASSAKLYTLCYNVWTSTIYNDLICILIYLISVSELKVGTCYTLTLVTLYKKHLPALDLLQQH